jgi:hypothetical protein
MAFSITPADSAPLASPDRYENGYRTAQVLVSTGKVFMYWISWIYGIYDVLAVPLLGGGVYRRYGPGMFVLQIVPGLYQVVYTWAMGLLLVGIGHIVTAALDTAASTLPGSAGS